MKHPKLRRIVVDGADYLFGRRHRHDAASPPEQLCQEIFTAYLEGHKRSPLRVWFTAGPGRGAGYPERGVVWLATPGGWLNLNTPGEAANVIRRARASGWDPVNGRGPFVIEDGFAVFLGPLRVP